MGITLAKMAANKATVTYLYGQDSVTITYLPNNVNEKVFVLLGTFDSAMANLEAEHAKAFEALNECLITLIASWNVYDDEAETVMFPLDIQRLIELPLAFRLLALRKITQDMRRPEANAPQS